MSTNEPVQPNSSPALVRSFQRSLQNAVGLIAHDKIKGALEVLGAVALDLRLENHSVAEDEVRRAMQYLEVGRPHPATHMLEKLIVSTPEWFNEVEGLEVGPDNVPSVEPQGEKVIYLTTYEVPEILPDDTVRVVVGGRNYFFPGKQILAVKYLLSHGVGPTEGLAECLEVLTGNPDCRLMVGAALKLVDEE